VRIIEQIRAVALQTQIAAIPGGDMQIERSLLTGIAGLDRGQQRLDRSGLDEVESGLADRTLLVAFQERAQGTADVADLAVGVDHNDGIRRVFEQCTEPPLGRF
jgi:hypothetical protein